MAHERESEAREVVEKKRRLRVCVIRELVQTEIDYCRTLDLLDKVRNKSRQRTESPAVQTNARAPFVENVGRWAWQFGLRFQKNCYTNNWTSVFCPGISSAYARTGATRSPTLHARSRRHALLQRRRNRRRPSRSTRRFTSMHARRRSQMDRRNRPGLSRLRKRAFSLAIRAIKRALIERSSKTALFQIRSQ